MMAELVLDASVVLKWFHAEDELHVAKARTLRDAFTSGDLRIFAPALLHLEIINIVARRWKRDRETLARVAQRLTDLPFETRTANTAAVATWAARGLSAYDAAYVVVAETEGIRLVTDDQQIIATAPRIALALSSV